MNTLTKINPIQVSDTEYNEEKRYAIKCILDHYEALGMSEEELFNRAVILWELELMSVNMVLSICIDQLINEFSKDH